MSERTKMLGGELYNAHDAELTQARLRARRLLHEFNRGGPDAPELRSNILHELFGSIGAALWIEPPFFCDYGSNIHLGERVFINFNCIFLDPAEVRVGDAVLFGPNVQVYTATHPLDHAVRAQGLEAARPVTVGSDVWLGGGAILLPGGESERVR